MTGSRPVYRRGDIVLVNFVFPDETGTKRRPALILSDDAYQQSRQEVIIAAVTSNVRRLLAGDCLISNWKGAGLLYASAVTGVIRTVKETMLERKLGALAGRDLQAVQQSMRHVLGL